MRAWRFRLSSSLLFGVAFIWLVCGVGYFFYLGASTPSDLHENDDEAEEARLEGERARRALELQDSLKNEQRRDEDIIHAVQAAAMPQKAEGTLETGIGEVAGKQDYSSVELDPQRRKQGYNDYGFNEALSEAIPLRRAVPDFRHSLCKRQVFPLAELPTASVIIIFHNEAWSTLLRTVYSVVNPLRTPPQLLKEIILVDDFSDKEHLKEKLDAYMQLNLPKVVVVRNPRRQGLIRSRLNGAARATGDVLLFLDSHCEVALGWLTPLLARIYESRTAVVIPVIDVIDMDTFKYQGSVSNIQVGLFSWDLIFRWSGISEAEKNRRKSFIDELRTPTMAGGLFAIERKYFYEMGTYDEQMEIWGGENMEMSFRIWQCGGTLEIMPCSHVGHIFRKRSPYTFPGGIDHVLTKNTVRVAEVWMDDYKELYYKRRPDVRGRHVGSLTERKELRQRLQCHSFQWYMENIATEVYIAGRKSVAWGIIRNPQSDLCLTSKDSLSPNAAIKLAKCNESDISQKFDLTQKSELRYEDYCADASRKTAKKPVVFSPCHGQRGNQEWEIIDDGTLCHHNLDMCLDSYTGNEAMLSACDPKVPSQLWAFKYSKQ